MRERVASFASQQPPSCLGFFCLLALFCFLFFFFFFLLSSNFFLILKKQNKSDSFQFKPMFLTGQLRLNEHNDTMAKDVSSVAN